MNDWGEYLRRAIEASDVAAISRLKREGPEGEDAWAAHLSLFPAVQRVLNPPYVNPHLPKMYAICRDLLPYLKTDDIPALLYVETLEYARRKKLERPRQGLEQAGETTSRSASALFHDVEQAIESQDPDRAASAFAVFLRQQGAKELARRILLLGSGYLDRSLGHSVSCTAFILREMLARHDQDPWPALVILADYFVKGRFMTTPPLRKRAQVQGRGLSDSLLRSTTGASFVDIHHTITFYAIERSRRLLSDPEYGHLVASWLDWMAEKEAHVVTVEPSKRDTVPAYGSFYEAFSALDTAAVFKMAVSLVASVEGRKLLGRFLIKGLCDLYQGDYDPHYVTGLGATLWMVEQHADHPSVASNVLYQYLDFLRNSIQR